MNVPDGTLRGRLAELHVMRGHLSLNVRHNTYTGPYDVDPKAWDETTLHTQDKLMLHDVNVNRIRYTQTTNPSGGLTCFIADEV